MTKRTNYTLWTIQILLAAVFLFAGGMKLVMPLAELTKGIPLAGWFIRFLGVAEVLGGLGLVLPGMLRIHDELTPVAAAALTVIMAGATVFSLLYAGAVAALVTVAIGCGLVWIAWSRIAAKPDTFRVERSRRIEAKPEAIYDFIADLHRWTAWSPFEKLDPAMTKTFSGAASGKGAVSTWSGNSRAGAGRMEIVEAARPSRVVLKLDFLKPMENHHTAEFTLVPEGDSTLVTWAMTGENNFFCKAMSLFLDMGEMIGKEFTEGLAKLQTIAENQPLASKEHAA